MKNPKIPAANAIPIMKWGIVDAMTFMTVWICFLIECVRVERRIGENTTTYIPLRREEIHTNSKDRYQNR